jgi:hypothetical protein
VEQHFLKSCGIAIAEVLSLSCGIAVVDSKKVARAHLWEIHILFRSSVHEIQAFTYAEASLVFKQHSFSLKPYRLL